METRRAELDAIKRGFHAFRMEKHIKLFTSFELMGLLQVCEGYLNQQRRAHPLSQGQQYLAAGDVISKLRFENFASSSKTPMYTCNCLKTLDASQLKR